MGANLHVRFVPEADVWRDSGSTDRPKSKVHKKEVAVILRGRQDGFEIGPRVAANISWGNKRAVLGRRSTLDFSGMSSSST